MYVCFNFCYIWIISHSYFPIKGGTRTSKQNDIYLWLKNYDHLYANESYVSRRLKRITQSHTFGTFLLFSHSRPSVVLAASSRVVRSKVDHIGLFHLAQSQLHAFAHIFFFFFCLVCSLPAKHCLCPSLKTVYLRSLPHWRFSFSRVSLCSGIDHVN